MFSQLTAFAKDFSLDNLQKDEEEEKNKPVPSSSLYKEEAQGIKNEENEGGEERNNVDNSSSGLSSSTFKGLFGSKSPAAGNDSPDLSTLETPAYSDSINNLFFGGSSKKQDTSISKTSPKNESNDASIIKPSEPKGSINEFVKKTNVSIDKDVGVAVDEESQLEQTSPKSPKKGSGREAAKRLEKRLRATITQLQDSLQEKNDALQQRENEIEHIRQDYCQISAEHTDLCKKFSSLEATLRHANSRIEDEMEKNEKLKAEVHALEESKKCNEKELEERAIHVRQLEDSENASLQASLKNAEAEVARLNALLKESDNPEDDHFSETHNESRISCTDGMEQEMASLRTEINDLKKSLESQRSDHESSLNKAELQYSRDIEAIQKEKLSVEETLNECLNEAQIKEEKISALVQEAAESDVKYNELKAKFNSFTEKTRTQVKKFIESQKVADEEKHAAAEALEAKEREVMSLRLKLETIDNTLSDKNAMSSEMAERYGELQRELQRKVEESSSKSAEIEDLHRQLSAKNEEISRLMEKVDTAFSEVSVLRSQVAEEIEAERVSCARAIQDEKSSLELCRQRHEQELREKAALLETKESECDTLQAEVAKLREHVDKGLGSQKALEDYKARAQKAIKQANNSSAALSSKLSKAENDLENLNQELFAANSVQRELEETAGKLEEELARERLEKRGLEERMEAEKSLMEHRVMCLEDQLSTAAKGIAKLENTRKQHEKEESCRTSDMEKHSKCLPKRLPMDCKLSPVDETKQCYDTMRSIDFYSNEDCVVIKDGATEYVEVEPSQSDTDNGGDISENSSVVVQWQKILPHHYHPHYLRAGGNNSPGSDTCTDTTSPSLKKMEGIAYKRSIEGKEMKNVDSYMSISSLDNGGGDSRREDGDRESGNYFYVNELKRELHLLRQELSRCHAEQDELLRSSSAAEEARLKAVHEFNELKAFHERTKKLSSSPDSAINIEYLKKCVYRLMVTKEDSERSRLYPVISTLLKFTPAEVRKVNAAIEDDLSSSSLLGIRGGPSSGMWSSASSALGDFFSGGGGMSGTVSSTGEVVSEQNDIDAASTSSSSWW